MTASGDREDTLTGTPQGGILSPLLANIALSALDDHFDRQRRDLMGSDRQRAQRKRRGLGNWKLVRYADDFVVMVSGQRGHAEALREEVAAVLAPLGLRLSPEKTRVVHIDEGFDFLGFHIRRRRKRGSQKQCVYTTPSRKAVQAAKDKVRWKTRRSTLHLDLAELITSLNQTLRGWATFFRHGVSRGPSTISTSMPGGGSWDGSARSIRARPDSAGRNFAAVSVIRDGGSPTRGRCSPAHPASK
jgi:RNA-directed DNA polymerase